MLGIRVSTGISLTGVRVFLAFLRVVVIAEQLQAGGATVTGVVRNAESEQPLVGAVVVMTDDQRSTLTDAMGRYVLRDVTAGPHHLSIRALGFGVRTLHALAPTAGVLDLNVSLTPIHTRLATLVVRPIVADVRTDDAPRLSDERQVAIDGIRSSPFAVAPDVLLALAGGAVRAAPESPQGLNVRGGATDHVAYALDGVPVFSPYHAAGMFGAWNPDAVDAVALRSVSASVGDLASLSGTVHVTSRAPTDTLHVSGVVSTTHTGLTAAGPVGVRDARFLVSARAGYPAASAPLDESSYVRGGTGDRLLTLDATALGGHVHVVGYDAEDEVNASSTVDTLSSTGAAITRNAFDWRSRSIGAEWSRGSALGAMRVLGWTASSDAHAVWAALDGPLSMTSVRRDIGVLVSATQRTARSITTSGIRVERSRTAYAVGVLTDARSDDPHDFARDASTELATAFATSDVSLPARTTVQSALSMTMFGGRAYASPRLQLRWQARPRLTMQGSVSRQHQFAQSVRNAESITGNIFPAELYVGAGVRGALVARSAHEAIGVEYQPTSGTRVGVQAFRARAAQVALVAANEIEPFATRPFDSGRSASRGVTIDATIRAQRFSVVTSYRWQRVSYATDSLRYVPTHGASHVFQGGINVYPTSTTSVRLAVVGEAGRRTSIVNGSFEWESCNLRDRGCEFGGSPRTDLRGIGTTVLPFYARTDLGVRKHWHASVQHRETEIAVFGTITNVLGRSNVLTYARSSTLDALTPIDMRPFAPLVLGMEWRF